MSPEEVQQLYSYNSWANQRILATAEKLTSAQFLQPMNSSFSSVRDTLAHIYGAEWIWLERFRGSSPPMPKADAFPDISTLREAWLPHDARLLGFTRSLTQAGIDREMEYKTFTMGVVQDVLRHALMHVVNHSTYHRGQVTTLLRQHGVEAVSTDMVRFFREQGKANGA